MKQRITKEAKREFWSKVNKSNKCWEWTGVRAKNNGYGIFKKFYNTRMAHRISMAMIHDGIPPGMLVCHKCDNPPCVRPSHLFFGTYSDNNQDAFDKGRKQPNSYVLNSFGINNFSAKLTDEAVRIIRRDYKRRVVSQQVLANRFGVSQVLVGQVIRRKIWKHIIP